MTICPVAKNANSLYRFKNTHLFAATFAPLAQGAKILTRDLSSAYIYSSFCDKVLCVVSLLSLSCVFVFVLTSVYVFVFFLCLMLPSW